MTAPATSPEQVFAAMVADGDMILDQLDARARELPDKTYIHYGEDGIRLSFAQFKQQTDRIAAGLVAAGLTPGQPVSVLTRNSLLATLAMYAIWRAGGVFAPINFNFRGPLLSYQITDTAPPRASTLPATDEGISTVALSVITSARIWSSATMSPTCTCQATNSTSAMPSPISGILIM